MVDTEHLTHIFEILACPKRWRIIQELRERPLYVTELKNILGIKQSGVSQHLRVLMDAGMVQCQTETGIVRREGMRNYRKHFPVSKRIYSLVPDRFCEAAEELDVFRALPGREDSKGVLTIQIA